MSSHYTDHGYIHSRMSALHHCGGATTGFTIARPTYRTNLRQISKVPQRADGLLLAHPGSSGELRTIAQILYYKATGDVSTLAIGLAPVTRCYERVGDILHTPAEATKQKPSGWIRRTSCHVPWSSYTTTLFGVRVVATFTCHPCGYSLQRTTSMSARVVLV